MPQEFDYKVIPAPKAGQKSPSARTPEDRFAYAMETLLRDMARDGWEYWRAETLPAQQRKGLWGKQNVWHDVLIFRRPKTAPEQSETAPNGIIPQR